MADQYFVERKFLTAVTKSVLENNGISVFFWPFTNLKFDDWFWRPVI